MQIFLSQIKNEAILIMDFMLQGLELMLSQHKETVKSAGGNYRDSIFSLLAGAAIIPTTNLNISTWGVGNTTSKDVKKNELLLE